MTKMVILVVLALVNLHFAGCGSAQSQMGHIGTENAKAAALEAAGLSASDVTFDYVELNENDGIKYYDIDFYANGKKYDYDIDALTGVVLDAEGPAVQKSLSEPASTELAPETAATSEVASAERVTSEAVPASQGNQSSSRIGEEKARELALAHAGLSSEQVNFLKSGLDRDDGRLVYDVEFYSNDYVEYDYDIDAVTGEILSFDHDAEYYTKPTVAAETPSNGMTADEAKELALSQVPGAVMSDIREFEVDYDDGRLEYEGKIYYNHMEYEFEIDGYSGAIRNWEVESIYD